MGDDSKITSHGYWKEIRALAKLVHTKEGYDEDADESDILHELIDGHEWIIYTWAYPWVLMHSDNEDALFDAQGPTEATNYSQIMQLMAFYAMEQDVMDALSRGNY